MLFLVLVEASASGEGGYSTNIWVQARVRVERPQGGTRPIFGYRLGLGLGDPRGGTRPIFGYRLGLGDPRGGALDQYLGIGKLLSV